MDPALWRAVAVPLPPPAPEAVALIPPEQLAEQLPPQLFCHFAEGTALELLPPTAAPQVFLTPPRNEESLSQKPALDRRSDGSRPLKCGSQW